MKISQHQGQRDYVQIYFTYYDYLVKLKLLYSLYPLIGYLLYLCLRKLQQFIITISTALGSSKFLYVTWMVDVFLSCSLPINISNYNLLELAIFILKRNIHNMMLFLFGKRIKFKINQKYAPLT